MLPGLSKATELLKLSLHFCDTASVILYAIKVKWISWPAEVKMNWMQLIKHQQVESFIAAH